MSKVWTSQVNRAISVKHVGGKAGFTLVELLTAVVISGILLTALGSLLFTDRKYWEQGTKKLRLLEDVSLAMHKMSHEIRRGSSEPGSLNVTVKTDSIHIGSTRYFGRDNAGNLVYHDPTTNITLIEGKADSLAFTYPVVRSPGDTLQKTVGVFLRATDGDFQTAMRSTIYLRN